MYLEVHIKMGHPGKSLTATVLQKRFHWHKMEDYPVF